MYTVKKNFFIGFEEARPHLLLGIIVRTKRKRPLDITVPPVITPKRTRIDTPPPLPTTAPRSYTPPPTRDPRLKLPTVPVITNDDDEPYSPEDSDPETTTPTLPETKKPKSPSDIVNLIPTNPTTNTLSSTDISTMLTASLRTNSFLDTAATAIPSFEPFNNKFDGIPGEFFYSKQFRDVLKNMFSRS